MKKSETCEVPEVSSLDSVGGQASLQKLKQALREVHEFLLSEPAQFTSPEAYQERKREVMEFFYVILDHIMGAPKGSER